MHTTPKGFLHRAPLVAVAAICAGSAGTLAASPPAMDANARQAILDCTFEVLAQMREGAPEGRAAYAVRVAGTAFCFGDGELASAAHVFDQILGSRFDAPVVRDRRGRIFTVDRILRYSMRDDFVVFSAAGLSRLPARPHNATDDIGNTLHLAWRRSDGNIAFGSTQYLGRSTVANLGRDGWVEFGPAPGHGASGAALLDGSGRVVALVNSRSSERADAQGFAVPIQQVEAASTEWADIAMRDPLRTLGMPSGRNMPLVGGIPLPAPYARFEQHMVEVRKTYFAHMLPYSLSLSGDEAPMSDAQRAGLCAALEPGYCVGSNDTAITRVRADGPSRGCAVAWSGVGAALVKCRTRAGLESTRMLDNMRAQVATASLARPFTQAPPAPCTNHDPLDEVAATDSFTDHTGADWKVRAWPVRGCDWVVLSMSRALLDGTLTLVRGAPSAYADAAAMQLKALTAIQREHGAADSAHDPVLAELMGAQGEANR